MRHNGIDVARSRSHMGAPKNRRSVALGANLRIGDEASFETVEAALRAAGGQLDGKGGACERLGVAHRTFMRWRQDIPRLKELISTIREDERKAAAARREAEAQDEGGGDNPENAEESNADHDDDGDDGEPATDAAE